MSKSVNGESMSNMGRDEHTTDDYQNRNGGGNEYTLNEIRDDMPTWKKNLLAKKNGEIMARMKEEKENEEKERQKYANVPGWKAEIMKKKDEEKRRQEELEERKQEDRKKQDNLFSMKPTWQQELIKRRNSYQNTA